MTFEFFMGDGTSTHRANRQPREIASSTLAIAARGGQW